MTSTYALPLASETHSREHHGHSHGHARSHTNLSPSEGLQSWSSIASNGSPVKQSLRGLGDSHQGQFEDRYRHDSMTSHAEATEPARMNGYSMSKSQSRARARGQSDLGRPATKLSIPSSGHAFASIAEDASIDAKYVTSPPLVYTTVSIYRHLC